MQIDDSTLHAWLDDELDAARRVEVDRWLAANPEAASRVQHWAADREALRALLAPLETVPPPAALVERVLKAVPASPVTRWALAASAAALLLAGGIVGAALGWRAAATPAQASADLAAGWVQRAAYAHSVYVPEPRHAVEVRAQEEHLARWLTRRIDLPVKLFDLREQGFELVGGRLLPDGDGKSAQLMYEDAQRLRVTVYLRKPPEGSDVAFRFERHGEVGLFYWVEAGAGYALVGALPKEQLLALAQSIHRQHPDTAKPPAR